MSKAKALGTRAETAVRNHLLSQGYSELEAHRNVLAGKDDEGDIWLRSRHGLIVFEIKGGDMAKKASHQQIEKWMLEADREKVNANGKFGFLVTQRSGIGYPRAGQWWAYAHLNDIIYLKTYLDIQTGPNPLIRIELNELVKLING